MRLAYLGPEGTFSEAALRTLPEAPGCEPVPCVSVADALALVRTGDADGAVVPFENSVEGSVSATLDDLATGPRLSIRRELTLPVRFALLARVGTRLADVRTVTTIPIAEAQCRGWLSAHLPAARVVAAASTADAAAAVAAAGSQLDAAVAAPFAAARYGLEVLADAVHDRDDAVTRFVLVGPPQPPPPRTGADRTTVVAFISDDHPGALLEILTELAVRGVNLSRIESRPTGGGLGRYFFSIDCEGHVGDAGVGEALSALHRVCAEVRFLGSYPRADRPAAAAGAAGVRRGAADEDFAAAAQWLAALRRDG